MLLLGHVNSISADCNTGIETEIATESPSINVLKF